MNSAIQVHVTTKQSSKLPKLRDGHICRKGTLYMNTYKKLSAKVLLFLNAPMNFQRTETSRPTTILSVTIACRSKNYRTTNPVR